MRSLDTSAERLDRVLEVLVQAGRALTLSPDVEAGLSRVVDVFVENFGDDYSIEVVAQAFDREEFRVAAGRALASPGEVRDTIVEPLSEGRRGLGTLTCWTTAEDGFDDIARKALRVLAIELGVVLAAQFVRRREHRVADRLQRALLPEHLPEVTGALFRAAYRPASDEAEVGGDWYDAFHLPDRRVAISIGDVAGHGLDAAVIMGELRQAMRTAALAAENPAAVLDYVNRIIAMRDSIGMVTAIFGIYDPKESTLSYAVAGHPAPLIAMSNGLVRRLPSGGLPLGCADSLGSKNWTITLPPGAHAIFYTDGLIENERDLIAGERRLMDAVRRMVRGEPEGDAKGGDFAERLQDSIFQGVSNCDDAAVLVLSRTAPVRQFLFSAVPIVSTLARAIVADQMETLGLEQERQFGVLVALGEAVANAVEHAYRGSMPGLIRFELANEAQQFVLTVEDFGHWKPFVRREERGRGLELMHALMDGVQIRSTHESTRILLTGHLSSGAAESG